MEDSGRRLRPWWSVTAFGRALWCRVEGVDLTPAFVELAEILSEQAGLADRINYTVGDVSALPFEVGRFDLVWCEHVAMNIADRPKLYRELRRVLKPGGLLAFYGVISIDGRAAPVYPLPWSETPATSFLLTREATLDVIGASGFAMQAERDVSHEALEWFQRISGSSPQGQNLSAGAVSIESFELSRWRLRRMR